MTSRSGAALIAEDEPLTRWAIATALGSMGYETRTTSSREETCGALFSGSYEVVVMACPLGDADMLDIVGELDRYRADTRLVVLCSGDCAGAAHGMAPRAAVLEKPFWVDELTAAIAGARPGPSPTAAGRNGSA